MLRIIEVKKTADIPVGKLSVKEGTFMICCGVENDCFA
jgi:hypothetical protein